MDSEKPDQENDDDDDSERSGTDVHNSSFFSFADRHHMTYPDGGPRKRVPAPPTGHRLLFPSDERA